MNVAGAVAYYAAVKKKIGHTLLWNEFQEIMNMCKAEKVYPCEVLARVSRLFHDFPDLLHGFEMFLPECFKQHLKSKHQLFNDCMPVDSTSFVPFGASSTSAAPQYNSVPHIGDDSVSHVAVYGTYRELEFFDKVKRALGYREVYENFLHCLRLFNDDHLTRHELVKAVEPFLAKFPGLQKQFKDILHINESGEDIEPISHKIAYQKKNEEDVILDIDYCSGKRLNASYRPLPKTHPQPLCSGRTPLCKEVLNDTWVSFPAWSEDSTFGASSKTKYEEAMYRIEDERFELDMAVQTNAYAIEVLDNVQNRIESMSDEEKADFSLDETLGGSSSILNYKFIHRIYGDRTDELMEGLKRNPVVAVPIVLNRLRVREKEWKDVQEKYNAVWSEQTNRFYLKSLDHQGINFKQNDAKNLRPKTLLNEIETRFEEKRQKIVEGSVGGIPGPHITCHYKDLRVFKNALTFILQDIKRQPGIYKDDRRHIADLLCFFITGFFNMQPDVINSCEGERKSAKSVPMSNGLWNILHLVKIPKTHSTIRLTLDQNCVVDVDSDVDANIAKSPHNEAEGGASEDDDEDDCDILEKKAFLDSIGKTMYEKIGISPDKIKMLKAQESLLPYSLFYVNNNWYIFFRLFSMLIERLANLYHASLKIEAEHKNEPNTSKSEFSAPYPILLNKVGDLLAGKIDSSRFEDEMRELFTIHAYVSYTLDKLVHAIVKQLHLISSDDVSKQCMTSYVTHAVSLENITCPWLLVDAEHSYEKQVVQTIGEENCYKIIWHKGNRRLAIELLDTTKDSTDQSVDVNMSDYLDNYLKDDILEQEIPIPTNCLPVVQRRNLKKQQNMWARRFKKMKLHKDQYLLSNFNITVPYPHKDLKRKNDSEICPTVSKLQKISSHDSDYSDYSHLTKAKNVVTDSNVEGGPENFTVEPSENVIECPDVVDLASCSDMDTLVVTDVPLPLENLGHEAGKNESTFLTTQSDVGVLEYDISMKESEEDAAVEPMAYDDDEDSINVSAEDLLYHLSQTGMAIFDHFPGSFVTSADLPFCQKNSNPEFVMDHRNNEVDSTDVCSASSKSDENQYAEYSDEQEEFHDDKSFVEPSFIHSGKNNVAYGYGQKYYQEMEKRREIPVGVFEASESDLITSALTQSSEDKGSVSTVFPGHQLHVFHPEKTGTSSISEKNDFIFDTRASRNITLASRNITIASSSGTKLLPSEQIVLPKDTAPLCAKPPTVNLETVGKDGNTAHIIHDLCSENGSDVSPTYDCSQSPKLKDCLELASQNMVIHDNSVCVFDGKTSKMQFAGSSRDFIYRIGSFSKARRMHRKVSSRISEKFNAWHRIWLEHYVTTNMLKSCHDWLLRSEPDKYRVECITVNDQTKPPYGPYTKYCVRFYKRR